MTDFRRRLRYHQARWREANGHPIGSQPIAPRPGDRVRPLGSRIPLDYALKTGANFVTRGALEAAGARAAIVEPHQSIDHQRLWADLLWSQSMAFNLFGDLSRDVALADRVIHEWWRDVPGVVSEVRFIHSPGRLDRHYLNSLRDFETAFVLELGNGRKGILAIATRYHEWAKPETPRPSNLRRYREVANRSLAFRAGAVDKLKLRTGFCLTWLEHLLLLSMLQQAGGIWQWGRYVLIYPAGNSDFADLSSRYRAFLKDDSTFSSMTLEDLLGAGALPPKTAAALRNRYLLE